MIRLRRGGCDLWRHGLSIIGDDSHSRQSVRPYPTGRASGWHVSRHFMPGYHHLVPTGQTHLGPYVDAHPAAAGCLAALVPS